MKKSKIVFLLIVNFFMCNIAFSKELVLSDYHRNPLHTVIMSHKRNDVDIANYISGQGSWFNKDPLEWDDKDFDKVDKYIIKEKLSIEKKDIIKFKELVKKIQLERRKKEEELEKIIEPNDYDGLWNCNGDLLALNLSGSRDYYGINKRCIAISGYEDVCELENIKWNEKEGKAIIEFKLAKGLSGIFSGNTVWNLSLENKKKTLVVKTKSETLFYKKESVLPQYPIVINRVVPDYVKKLDKDFLKTTVSGVVRVVDGEGRTNGSLPKEMVGLSIKDILTYIYNMKQFDCIQMQNVDNQNRAIVQFQNGFKTVNLVFYFDKSAVSNNGNPNSCIVIIVGANKKAIDEFISLYDIGMSGKNINW